MSFLDFLFSFAKSASELQGGPQPYSIMSSTLPPTIRCHFQENRGWKESGGPTPLEWRFPYFQSGSFGQLQLVGLWFG